MRVNLSNESSGGGGTTPVVNEQNPAAQSQPPPPASSASTAPPAASAVIQGEVTEETLRLREENAAKDRKIEELGRTVKDRETTICANQDRHDQYRKQVEEGTNVPVKRRFLRR